MHTENHVVIMAGGIGSRFWPMSTVDCPKQFLDILGTGRTLIQMTLDRLLPVCPAENVWIVTSARYVEMVHEQLPDVPMSHILPEPAARNTAPCIAYACWKIRMHHPHANIVVTPSDALVLNTTEYARVINAALAKTADSDAIVTVGIKPSRPETGYGYIEVGASSEEICPVAAFKEKPDLETAQKYFAAGNYLWNAGIFVWNVDTITDAIRTHSPQIAGVMDEIAKVFYTERENATIEMLFPTCEKISIDYAVMEKAGNINTIPAEFGWSDLGTWGSLHANMSKDADGNAVSGVAELHECKGCVVHTSGLEKVVLEGLEDYIVAEKGGRLLVCRLSNEQKIKEFQK